MKAKSKTVKFVFLELTEREAILLRDLCQNPADFLSASEREIMKSVFNGIKEALNGTANEEDIIVLE